VVLDNPDEATKAEASRLSRLAAGLRQVEDGGGGWVRGRLLVMISGALVGLGLVLVLLGWHGASRSPNVNGQIPYLISGGQLGGTLALLGGFFYFGHWLTALIKEQRAQGAAIVAAIERLEAVVAQASAPTPDALDATLVATARGTLAHRPDCSVVAGKHGLRSVSPTEALPHCRLCLPEGL
jgi:hypothetical protein